MSGEIAAPADESPPLRFLRRAIAVKPGELEALGWAWLYLFALMMSYYIMRPIRDTMGIAKGTENLPWLFTGTLVAMVVLNVPFGALVRALPRVRFVSITYRFFALNILMFALALRFADKAQTVWIGYAFYIWLSVFNLFVVSVFWAMIVDTFNSEQGKRLFASVSAAATVGGLMGASVVVALARHVSTTALLIAAALLLEVAVFGVKRLSRYAERLRVEEAQIAEERVGGSIWAGFTKTFSSSYLIGTALFLLLFSLTSTLLYFAQADAVAHAFTDKAAQKQFFGTVDLLTQGATLAIQLFLTNRIVRSLGVTVTLALLPALSIFGFAAIAALPTLAPIVLFYAGRRAGNFAVARPTREVLYTVLPREDRYKAKSFIDTVVYRFGDLVGAWTTDFVHAFGVGRLAIAAVAIALSALWLADSVWIGRRQERMAAEQEAAAAPADVSLEAAR